jgi:histidine phosphotransferase ChpT
MTARLKLAELISARLCHDLAGSLGTLTASLEIVAEGGADAAEALEIAQDSAKGMNARLRFVRAAWAVDGATHDGAALLDYCAPLPQARKVSFDFAQLVGSFSVSMSRGLLNLLLLGIESLPRGGAITLAGDQVSGAVMSIKGAHAAWPDGFAALLCETESAWTGLRDSRTLQAPLTALILGQCGLRLRFLMAGGDPGSPPPVLLVQE